MAEKVQGVDEKELKETKDIRGSWLWHKK